MGDRTSFESRLQCGKALLALNQLPIDDPGWESFHPCINAGLGNARALQACPKTAVSDHIPARSADHHETASVLGDQFRGHLL